MTSEVVARDRLVTSYFMRLAQGRMMALGGLYDVIGSDLYGYIRSIVGSPADAEDVFQEVFARLAALGPRLCRVEKPLPYLFTMARNEAFRLIRTRGNAPCVALDEGLLEIVPAGEERRPALTPQEVECALSTLPHEQREVIVLKIFEGFTFAEIADITGVSPNTAASRYRYALAKLAHKLGRVTGSI